MVPEWADCGWLQLLICILCRECTLYLSPHSDTVLQTVRVGGLATLPCHECHRGPVTPLEVEVSPQVVQTQPQLLWWLWSTRKRFGYCPLHRTSRDWYVSQWYTRDGLRAFIKMLLPLRDVLWKNHHTPFRKAGFNEHKALYGWQKIFANFLWFRTTKWSWAWGVEWLGVSHLSAYHTGSKPWRHLPVH